MADFNIRSDSVNVEQIMAQIRARIQEKRGVDYTEEQIRELASVRLEKFLDPKNLRSDLLEQFRHSRPSIAAEPSSIDPPYTFSDQTLFATHRGVLRLLRAIFRPILKLFFNPNTLNQVLHAQAQFNVDLLKREQRRKIEFDRSRADWNALYYEVLHNLVLETTRNGIELKNLKMRVEALASRLDFSERRVRALEGVVQYRPEIVRPRTSGPRDQQRLPQGGRPRDEADEAAEGETTARPEPVGAAPPDAALGEPGGRRRRRRRRGRRGAGGLPGAVSGSPADQSVDGTAGDEEFEGGDDGDAGDLQGGPDAVSTDEGEMRRDAGAATPREPERHAGAAPAEGSPAPDASHAPSEGAPPARPSDPHAQ